MLNKNILVLILTIIGISSLNAQTWLINKITYEKVNTEWYQVYNGDRYQVDESTVTVKFIPGIDDRQKTIIADKYKCKILRSNSLGYYDLQIHADRAAIDVVRDLLRDSSIEFAEPNTIGEYVVHANDTYYGDQWHLNISAGNDAYKAWNKENGNPDAAIGILDSGTDILHEDLEGNIWINPGEDLDGDGEVWDADDMNGIDDDGNGLIDDLSGWDFENNNNDLPGPYYHGTHVAGIAGAETNDLQGVAGVAGGWTSSDKGCGLLIGAVGGNSPVGSVLDDAILYSTAQGAKVITMSLTVGFSQAIVDAIDAAYASGVFVDNASGNGYASSLPFPANVGNCFAVGASNQSSLREGFSNYGIGLMVVAPGTDIKSTRQNNSYGTGSGTSYASPQVAGTAGLISSRHPDFTAEDIEEVICLTATKMSPSTYTYTDGYEHGSWNNQVGYGRLNVDRAIGIKEDITSSFTLKEGYYIRDEVHVTSNSTLTLDASSRFYLLKTGQLIVDAGATLIIGDNVSISGNFSNKIIVNGNIQIGQNVTFNKHGNTGYFYGLELNNSNMHTTINNATFNEARLANHGAVLNITHSTFNGSGYVYSFNGDVTINTCDFTNTWLYLANQQNDPNLMAWVNNSTFNNPNSSVGIDISEYDNYWIDNNDISTHRNGIQLINCGDNNFISQQIYNNTIHDCGWAGVLAYHTRGTFYRNYIHDNGSGIKMMNQCKMSIHGDPNAANNLETNYITDNDSYEIYISKYSFPWYFKHNVIIDEDNVGNPGDPLLYFAYPAGSKINQKDIKYNCWGNNFAAVSDLYPHTYFLYDPTWCPGGSSKKAELIEQMYFAGKQQLKSLQYADSKSTFMTIIESYPESEQAISAMKELVSIEQFASNDYEALKEYYQTNDYIQADEHMKQLAISLVNHCDIKLENYSEAIHYYESVIENPTSLEESVFAKIDLGYLYLKLENKGEKSSFTGRLLQYKPESKEQFFEHRDYLLSLLPGDDIAKTKSGEIAEVSDGELLHNVPNPFKENTQINYTLEFDADVQLKVYNYTGQLLSHMKEGTKAKGTHQIDFNAYGLQSGIYLYSISINGKTTASKKMTIIK